MEGQAVMGDEVLHEVARPALRTLVAECRKVVPPCWLG